MPAAGLPSESSAWPSPDHCRIQGKGWAASGSFWIPFLTRPPFSCRVARLAAERSECTTELIRPRSLFPDPTDELRRGLNWSH
jgi:hypothetical protein